MANNTFTTDAAALGIVGGGTPVFLDAAGTQRATLFATSGLPTVGNTLNIPERGPLQFQVPTVTTVYIRNSRGVLVALTNTASPPAVERRVR